MDLHDRTYKAYYHEVGKYPILTPAEERALFEQYQICPMCHENFPDFVENTNCPKCGAFENPILEGNTYMCSSCTTKYPKFRTPITCGTCGSTRDLRIRDKLATANLRFVVKRAISIAGRRSNLVQSLISAGNVGLLLAIDRFSLRHATRFLTYADWWVRREMYDMMGSSHLVRVPAHKQKAMRKQARTPNYICAHCGLETTDIHADFTETPCTYISHAFALADSQRSFIPPPVSLDESPALCPDPATRVDMDRSAQKAIQRLLKTSGLSERDKYIVAGYYNIAEESRRTEAKSLFQIAAMLSITPERVRQIKTTILNKFKRELHKASVSSTSDVVHVE
jgi:RNA polymerase sigma factor (sigma-70 family)